MYKNYRVAVLHRNSEVTERLEQALVPADGQMLLLAHAWRMSLGNAGEVDFLLMARGGVIADAATVIGAEPVQARYGSTGRVGFCVSLEIPAWLEGWLGAEIPAEFTGNAARNPAQYGVLAYNALDGAVYLGR